MFTILKIQQSIIESLNLLHYNKLCHFSPVALTSLNCKVMESSWHKTPYYHDDMVQNIIVSLFRYIYKIKIVPFSSIFINLLHVNMSDVLPQSVLHTLDIAFHAKLLWGHAKHISTGHMKEIILKWSIIISKIYKTCIW